MDNTEDGVAEEPEPLEALPPGMRRYFAEYKPVDPHALRKAPPTNEGGYEDLRKAFQVRGLELARSPQGLSAVDLFVEAARGSDSLAGLARAVGVFYGDVLTHTIPRAHWEVIGEGSPAVRVTGKTSVDVVGVAERLISIGTPHSCRITCMSWRCSPATFDLEVWPRRVLRPSSPREQRLGAPVRAAGMSSGTGRCPRSARAGLVRTAAVPGPEPRH